MFADLLRSPEISGRVVVVVEPDPIKREIVARECGLSDNAVFDSAESFFAQPKMADAVINTTMDRAHAETAIPAMEKGYHLLLEKPMAVTLEDCIAIEETQRRTGVVVGICHSLRYHALYATIKQI